MYVNFPLRDLDSDLYPLHLTNTHICGVITVLRVRGHHACYKFFNLENITPTIGRGIKGIWGRSGFYQSYGFFDFTSWFKVKSISLRSFYLSLF